MTTAIDRVKVVDQPTDQGTGQRDWNDVKCEGNNNLTSEDTRHSKARAGRQDASPGWARGHQSTQTQEMSEGMFLSVLPALSLWSLMPSALSHLPLPHSSGETELYQGN